MIFVLFLSPLFVSAQTKGTGIVYVCNQGQANEGDCTFNDLLAAVRKVINQGTIIALGFSVVVIAYAGYRYMISGSNPGERTKANKMLQSVAIGIFFVLAAWLIVNLITTSLLKEDVLQAVPLGK